jgi:hypothetical protein
MLRETLSHVLPVSHVLEYCSFNNTYAGVRNRQQENWQVFDGPGMDLLPRPFDLFNYNYTGSSHFIYTEIAADASKDYTCESWFYMDSNANIKAFNFGIGLNSGLRWITIGTDIEGERQQNFQLRYVPNDGVAIYRDTGLPIDIFYNQWHHYAITYSGASKRIITFYMDGTKVCSWQPGVVDETGMYGMELTCANYYINPPAVFCEALRLDYIRYTKSFRRPERPYVIDFSAG